MSLSYGCDEETKSVDNPSVSVVRGDLIVQVFLFEGENVTVWLNDSVFYTRTVEPGAPRMFEVYRRLPAEKVSLLRLQTEYLGRIYLDSTIAVGTYYPQASLRISTTVPFPFDYAERMKTDSLGRWGYLPIDSSLRFINFSTE